jgi:hypothetical protein
MEAFSMRIVITKELREDSASSGIFGKRFVGVAPHPFLTRFGGDDDGMPGPMKMLGHVLMPGVIAAKGNSTGLAGTQVHPGAAVLDTFFASVFFCLLQVFYLLHVGANFICHIIPPLNIYVQN